MSVTSGFFNSLKGDRRYDAEQIASIFDGIVGDGVFASVGEAFAVKASASDKITVGSGRAWFNHTWLYNDSAIALTLEPSEVLLDRYDAVVIEINHTEAVRDGLIKVVKGTPSSSPQYPTMVSENQVHQYPLAYILRKAGSDTVAQSEITVVVGMNACPFVTGLIQVQSIENIVAQWMSEWAEITDAKEEEFDEWFATIKAILDEDVATELVNRVTKIEDGTTRVGDSEKLGGYGAEYFAPLSRIIPQSMPSGTDLNACIETGVYYFSNYATSYINVPNGDAHNGVMIVNTADADKLNCERITQMYFSINQQALYFRTSGGSVTSWGEWKTVFTTEGGTINGDIRQVKNGHILYEMENPNRKVTFVLHEDGSCYLYDEKYYKMIYYSDSMGENTFNGTATGNLPLTGGKVGYLYVQGENKNGYSHLFKNASAIIDNGTNLTDVNANNQKATLEVSANANSIHFIGIDNVINELLHSGNVGNYALPLTGGKITNFGATPLKIDCTNPEAAYVAEEFLKNGVSLGLIGINENKGAMYKSKDGGIHALHHDGNSAKVAIRSSAPSDTSALWVY